MHYLVRLSLRIFQRRAITDLAAQRAMDFLV